MVMLESFGPAGAPGAPPGPYPSNAVSTFMPIYKDVLDVINRSTDPGTPAKWSGLNSDRDPSLIVATWAPDSHIERIIIRGSISQIQQWALLIRAMIN